MTTGQLLYSCEDAAKALSLSRSKVKILVREQVIPSVKIGRSRRITSEALAAYVESLTSDAA